MNINKKEKSSSLNTNFNYFIIFFKKFFFNLKLYFIFLIVLIILLISFLFFNKTGGDPTQTIGATFVSFFVFINFYIYSVIFLKLKKLFFKQENKILFYFNNFLNILILNILFLIIFLFFIWFSFKLDFIVNNFSSSNKYKVYQLNFLLQFYSLIILLIFTYSFCFLLSRIFNHKHFNICFVSLYILFLAYLITTILIYGDTFYQKLDIASHNAIKDIGNYQYYDNSTNTLYYSFKASDDFIDSSKPLMILLSLNPFYILYLIFGNSTFTLNLFNDLNYTYQGLTLTQTPETHLQYFTLFNSDFSDFKYDSWIILMWLPYIYGFLSILIGFLFKNNTKNKSY